MASTHQAPSGADARRASGATREGRLVGRRLPRRLQHRRLRVVGPARSRTGCRSTPRPVRRAERPGADARGVHERTDRRRVPRLRRAAVDASSTRRCSTSWRSGLGLDPLEFRHRNALRAGDRRRPPARCCRRAPACAPASRRCDRTGRRRCSRPRRFNHRAGGGRRGSKRPCAAAPASPACGTASATRRSPTRPRCASACGRDGGVILFYNGAVDIGQGSNTILVADRSPTRSACRWRRSTT